MCHHLRDLCFIRFCVPGPLTGLNCWAAAAATVSFPLTSYITPPVSSSKNQSKSRLKPLYFISIENLTHSSATLCIRYWNLWVLTVWRTLAGKINLQVFKLPRPYHDQSRVYIFITPVFLYPIKILRGLFNFCL